MYTLNHIGYKHINTGLYLGEFISNVHGVFIDNINYTWTHTIHDEIDWKKLADNKVLLLNRPFTENEKLVIKMKYGDIPFLPDDMVTQFFNHEP